MERRVNYCLMLSLKEISLRRVVVILRSQPNILASYTKFGIEEQVKENVRKLDLPQMLIEQMIYLVQPINMEITFWKRFHAYYLETSYEKSDVYILQQLCWTILGTIDYRKSAEKLIRLEVFDTVKLYRLACLYCLDDYIPVLWEKLPKEYKIYFYKTLGHFKVSLEFCWPHILKGEGSKLDYMFQRPFENPTTFNQVAFEDSACEGNKAATEYFFQKLTSTEREISLSKAAQAMIIHQNGNVFSSLGFPYVRRCDTFCYLLFLMSPEQQREVFKEHPYNVLMFYLMWPWTDLFSDIAELIWPYLTADDYVQVLQSMCDIIKSGYNLTKLFRKFFLDGPSDFRKLFANQECVFGFSFPIFFRAQDSDTIKIIFRNVDYVDRKRLVSSNHAFKLFSKSIMTGKGHLVELCLQEATLSIEDEEQLKGNFFGFLSEVYFGNTNRRENIWEHFLHIFDEGKVNAPMNKSFDEDDLLYLSSDSDVSSDVSSEI